MKFLIDNQLPRALSDWVVSRGCDCIHVEEVGLGKAPDKEIWRFACENDRIVISKDEDFLFPASSDPSKAGLIWVRLGNCRTKALLRAFEQLWPKVEELLNSGERIIEAR